MENHKLLDGIRSSLVMCVCLLISASISSCDDMPQISRRQIDIVFTKLPSVIIDESGKLTPDGQNLFLQITGSSSKCNYTYVLDPELIRPDVDLKHSIATVIEKSGFVETTKPEAVVKYLKQNLDTLVIPESFTKNPISKVIADSSFFSYMQLDNLQGDSIIVFMTNQKNSFYDYNGKKHKTFSSIDDTRKQIQSILCSNPKATIALLIDPPSTSTSSQVNIIDIWQDCNIGTLTVQAVGGDGSPITYGIEGLSSGQSSNKFTLPRNKRNGKSFAVFAMQKGQRVSKQFTTSCPLTSPEGKVEENRIISRRTVVSRAWTRVAGSNFCVGSCILAYTERDNLGNTRERRVENYAGCCPANN